MTTHPSDYSSPVRHPGPRAVCRICPPVHQEPPVNLTTVDLSAAAAMVVAAHDAGGAVAVAAMSVWSTLTRLDGPEAWEYAQTLAADPDTTVTATVAPF